MAAPPSPEELRSRLPGVHAYPVTPFTPDFEIDEAGLRRNVRFLLDSGITHLTPLGSTGEFPNLSAEEQKRVITAVLEETKGTGAVVIAGCGGNSTRGVVEMARWSADAGVDGILVPPPSYFPASLASAKAHLTAVSDAVDVGILFYYLPDWHHLDVTAGELIDLLGSAANAVGLKDAGLDMIRTERYLRRLGGKVVCIGGGGEYTAAYTYMVGGKGIVSMIANFWPELPLRMHRAGMAGDYAGVLETMREVGEFLDFMYDNYSTLLTKRAMEMRGLAGGPVRLPLVDRVTPEQEEALAGFLREYGLI